AHRGGERFLLASTTTRLAAPIIIASGESVMAMGGFHGIDPAIDPPELERRVRAKELRFVVLGDAPPTSRRLGSEQALAPINRWVREHGKRVDTAWRSGSLPRGME